MKQFIICPQCGYPILALISVHNGIRKAYGKQYFFKCEHCDCEGFDYDVQLAKAVSVRQPWTFLIASGIKPIENRIWPTKYRGPVLLHAGAQYDIRHRNMSQLFTPEQWDYMPMKNYMTHGVWDKSAIIGTAQIIDCVRNHPSIWAEKEGWNWVMDNPVLFEKPVLNVKGRLSFFIPVIN